MGSKFSLMATAQAEYMPTITAPFILYAIIIFFSNLFIMLCGIIDYDRHAPVTALSFFLFSLFNFYNYIMRQTDYIFSLCHGDRVPGVAPD